MISSLDTHLGSGSIAIACHCAGMHLTACEIDPDYLTDAKARIARETSQMDFFIPQNDEMRDAMGEKRPFSACSTTPQKISEISTCKVATLM